MLFGQCTVIGGSLAGSERPKSTAYTPPTLIGKCPSGAVRRGTWELQHGWRMRFLKTCKRQILAGREIVPSSHQCLAHKGSGEGRRGPAPEHLRQIPQFEVLEILFEPCLARKHRKHNVVWANRRGVTKHTHDLAPPTTRVRHRRRLCRCLRWPVQTLCVLSFLRHAVSKHTTLTHEPGYRGRAPPWVVTSLPSGRCLCDRTWSRLALCSARYLSLCFPALVVGH